MMTLAGAAGATAIAAKVCSIEAERTQFKVTMRDGTVLRSLDLLGAEFDITATGRAVRLRAKI